MKRRLFLIIAIVLIAISACTLLVACNKDDDGNKNDNKTNIAASPTEFMEQWKSLNGNKYFKDYEGVVLAASGNIVINDANTYKVYYEVPEKNKLNYYQLRNGSWVRKSFDNFEDIAYEFKYQLNGYTELNNAMPFVNTAAEYEKFFDFPRFEQNCTKTDNVFTGNAGTVYQKVKMTITEKDLSIEVPSNFNLENYDPEQENVTMFVFKFGIGYNTVTIPEEARNAQDITNKRVIEKAIVKYLNSSNVHIKYRDNDFYLYNNIIKIENENVTAYVEMQNNQYVLYVAEKGTASIVWTAEALGKEAFAEKVGDIINAGLNPHNFDDIKDLFNEISSNQLTYYNGIDLLYELVADGVYKSKDNENEKIEIKETKVVYYYYDEIEAEISNCNEFIIPQEAKDALNN